MAFPMSHNLLVHILIYVIIWTLFIISLHYFHHTATKALLVVFTIYLLYVSCADIVFSLEDGITESESLKLKAFLVSIKALAALIMLLFYLFMKKDKKETQNDDNDDNVDTFETENNAKKERNPLFLAIFILLLLLIMWEFVPLDRKYAEPEIPHVSPAKAPTPPSLTPEELAKKRAESEKLDAQLNIQWARRYGD